MTSPERTLLDLAGVLPPHRLRRAVRQRRVVPDLRWPRERLVIEADGPHHDDPLARADDLERQRLLEVSGDRVLRVTWEQAIARQRATLRRIASAGAPRVSTDCP